MRTEELKYIDYDEALVVYAKTVTASGGGLSGVKDEGGIRKVLDFVQNDLYYPTFIDKLTYLVLVHNGYYWHAYSFMQCMEAIIYHVAAGRIDKDLLQRIITCFMANEDYPEDLKLEIIHAIDDQPTGIDE